MRRVAALGFVVVACISTVRAQSPAPTGQTPVFRAGVELVQVDAVVLDLQTGEPVHGLKASDFTVRDRRQPQTVSTFSEVNFEHDTAEPTLPLSLPLDVADNTTAQAGRIVIVVVDDLHITASLTDTTKDIVRQLVQDLGPEATVGLTFTSGRRGWTRRSETRPVRRSESRPPGAVYSTRSPSERTPKNRLWECGHLAVWARCPSGCGNRSVISIGAAFP
jgi:hypothetical protein